MRTLITSVVLAAACCLSMAFRPGVNSTNRHEVCALYTNCAVGLIGGGKIKEKDGSVFRILSNDGNLYQAPFDPIYMIGDSIYHSTPENGWVEILGLVEDDY